jgi:hypothetical protein
MNKKAAATILLAALMWHTGTNAGDRQIRRRRETTTHNYIIERQQAGQVTGPPIGRRIIGSREIDIYKDGSMFEKNNYVGSSKR